MNRLTKCTFFTLIFLSFSSCEKRIPIDAVFPHESSKLFCEIIGFPERGFVGIVSKIKSVQGNESTVVSTHISIWEDDILVIDQSHSSDLFIPFDVDPNKDYKLEINYHDNKITSKSNQVVLPQLKMNNFQVTSDYIDSLGIYVINSSFDFETPLVITDSIYYVPNFSLTQFDDDYTQFGAFMKPKSIIPNKPVFINNRLANPNHYHAFRMNLFIIDKGLYEYLKSIVQLGQVPNNDTNGHHGNISGGVGYFGIINYDTKFRYL